MLMKHTIIAIGLMMTVQAGTVEAQRQRSRGHSDKEILVLNPTPAASSDAAYAVQLGDRVRNRMDFRFRRRIDTFQTDRICEAMEVSGFECDASLDDIMVGQMATFLNAEAYFIWDLRRENGAPATTIRMVDTGRSGVSGWTTVVGEANQDARSFADLVVDSLAPQMDAANNARRCYDDRDGQDYNSAKGRAADVFESYPNHPSAATCLSTVYEAEGGSIDSIIDALERVVRGDTLNARIWQRLGQSYIQRGDTLAAAEAFVRQVNANPNDMDQRFGVAIMYQRQAEYQKALDLIQYAIDRDPTNMIGLNMKAEICVIDERWDCVLETLGMIYEADSTTHQDAEFYQQLFGAAQAVSDTAALLQWSGIAVDAMPDALPLWRARAQALNDSGQLPEALSAYRRIAALDTADMRPTLAAARISVDWIVIDSLVELDSSAIALTDTLLQETLERDPSVGVNVGLMYFQKAVEFYRGGLPDLAVEWLDKGILYAAANDQIVTQASFYLGLSLYTRVATLDGAAVDAESCSAVDTLEREWTRAVAALTLGRMVHEPSSERFLGIYQQWEERIPQLKGAFCS